MSLVEVPHFYTMSQNLCLICCYSFQEKRSRFISDEARESFSRFCAELEFPVGDDEGSEVDKGQKKLRASATLDLPFGEHITVCGDCLSLIVLYIQRRTVQMGREEKLLELQKAVCAALKELREAVEEVQGHIDQLHSTIRMGDESCLKSFYQKFSEDEANDPRSFRRKVLKLSASPIVKSHKHNYIHHGQQLPINIKIEPADMVEDETFSCDQTFSEDGDYDEPCYPAQEAVDGENNSDFEENSSFQIPEVANTSSIAISDNVSSTKRNARRRVVPKKEEFMSSQLLETDFLDLDILKDTSNPIYEDDDSASVDSYENNRRTFKKTRRLKRNSKNRVKLAKKLKTGSSIIGSNLQELTAATQQSAAEWKDDLISRIVMQMNNDINEPLSSQEIGDSDNRNLNITDNLNLVASNTFQLVNGELKLRGVVVKIRENNRALQCTRCGKKYFEKRDVTGEDVQLETLMRDHILSKHCVKKVGKPLESVEVVAYTSTTRNKITYKLACSHKYSYTRRATNIKTGGQYYRCDYRLENCGATILLNNGTYQRMKRGWNPDGTHTIHAPDVERTNRQMEIGKAKEIFLKNSTKSIDDVCDDIINQSNGQLKTPLERLRRRLLYAKYKTTGMPQEEKLKRSFKCPQCDLVYKEKRGLTRHIKTRHERSGIESSAASSSKKSSSPKKARKLKSEIKPIISDEPAPVTAEGPSIVFNDAAVANNFVNKCITAIIQQVGLTVSGNNPASVRPVAQITSGPNVENVASTSVSPAPSDISQHDQTIPSHQHSRAGNLSSTFGSLQNPAHWQQQASISPHGSHQQGQFLSNSNHTNNANQQTQNWPWNLH